MFAAWDSGVHRGARCRGNGVFDGLLRQILLKLRNLIVGIDFF